MANESGLHKRSLLCRLCLRVYSKEKLMNIFAKGCEYEQTIFAAVSIELLREDQTTCICVHCRDIISLIDSFKIACQQSNTLLKNGSCILESDAWSHLNEIDIFQQAANLVQIHQQEINAMFRKYKLVEDIKWEQESRSSHKMSPEYVALNSEDISESIKEEVEDEEQLIDIKLIDIDVEHHQDNMQDLNSGLSMFEGKATDEQIIIASENIHRTATNEDSESESEIIACRKRSGWTKSDNKRDNQEKVVCSTCGELVSQRGLEGHQNRHLSVQPFACDVKGCEAKLYSKFALQQHRSRHKSTNRYYDCEVCGKRIKGTAYWMIHRKIHTEEPRFSCDICGKKFRRKCKLKVHSTVHSGIADYPCEICGKYFTVKHNLTAHYKLHMKNGTYPPGFEPSSASEGTKTQGKLS